jgi:rhodanese-related sulfurtransferase
MDLAGSIAPRITPAQAREMVDNSGALIVDIRDAVKIKNEGKIAGSIGISRGMLEFRADPDMPYHDNNFSKDRAIIIYDASVEGSALSAKLLINMGYRHVFDLGTFKNWVESGGAIEAG